VSVEKRVYITFLFRIEYLFIKILLLTNCFYKQINMMIISQQWMFSYLTILVLVLLLSTSFSSAATRKTNKNIKTNVFMSPKIELCPGFVSNKVYYDVEFPRGHISLKSFNAELVDEAGNSIPLYQTYLCWNKGCFTKSPIEFWQ